MQIGRWIRLAAMGVALAAALPAGAQQCDDFDACTQNDMCVDGECTGSPVSSGACDDFNECTTNDRCDPVMGCTGDPAIGVECAGGCGVCTNVSPVPGFEVVLCAGQAEDNGTECDTSEFGPCLTGTCQIFETVPEQPAIALCIPAPVECPAAAGCRGVCNPETGQCDNSLSRCFPTCERCNEGSNTCEPANLGAACEDFDPCTTQSSCQAEDFGGGMLRGFCFEGTPSVELPTPTATQGNGGPTPTATIGDPTPTRTTGPPAACVGDCSGDGAVTINELIIGVNLALGGSSDCDEFDVNDDGSVAINELIAAVNSALNGCVS